MSETALLNLYRSISPSVGKIYVIPDIEKFSRHNTYLQLLYGNLLDKNSPVAVQSFSIVPLAIILRRLSGEQSVVHHHWFECRDFPGLLNVFWKFTILGIYRFFGGKIVWTVHNRLPHSGKWLRINRFLRKIWSKFPQKIHVHCKSAIQPVSKELGIPAHRFFVVEHPPYPAQILPADRAKTLLAEQFPNLRFSSDQRIFLMFGYIAPYKGILEVAEIFEKMNSDKVLVIAGSVKREGKEYAHALKIIADRAANIHIITAHIPETEVPLFFNAVDTVIFNYRDILQSGGVVLARSYHKTVIVPTIGCLKELTGSDVHHFENIGHLNKIISAL